MQNAATVKLTLALASLAVTQSFTVQAMPGRNDGVVQGSAADGSVVSSLSSVLSGVSGGASLEGSGRHQQMDMVFEVYDYDLIGANDFLGRWASPDRDPLVP